MSKVDIYEETQKILNAENCDEMISWLLNIYTDNVRNCTKVATIANMAMSRALSLKDDELMTMYRGMESVPQKSISQLSESDLNDYYVLNYCMAKLNFPKMYEQAKYDSAHHRFMTITEIINYISGGDKLSEIMWNKFKEIIDREKDKIYDENEWWWNDDNSFGRGKYARWCIEHMDLIEGKETLGGK